MSLDIAILDAEGAPQKQVSIGVNDHYRLMQLAAEKAGSLLARMNDYYGDAKYESAELAGFIREAIGLRVRCSQDERLLSLLDALIELAETAQTEQKPLIAIAD